MPRVISKEFRHLNKNSVSCLPSMAHFTYFHELEAHEKTFIIFVKKSQK